MKSSEQAFCWFYIKLRWKVFFTVPYATESLLLLIHFFARSTAHSRFSYVLSMTCDSDHGGVFCICFCVSLFLYPSLPLCVYMCFFSVWRTKIITKPIHTLNKIINLSPPFRWSILWYSRSISFCFPCYLLRQTQITTVTKSKTQPQSPLKPVHILFGIHERNEENNQKV